MTVRCLAAAALTALPLLALAAGVAAQGTPPPAGPPYPAPINDVVVYDYADVLSPQAEAAATQIIVAIEQRTGAEVVVYTQFKPGSTTDSTAEDARQLLTQWGVGRAGFDDGLAVFVNMNRQNCLPGVSGNGQIQLYAAPGYQATYLDNAERQRIFDDDMLPHLRECDFDSGILAGLARVDVATTPENAQRLQLARQINAVIGLVGAPLIFIFLVGVAGRSWLRYGKDPVYLDSPSILMPAPPAGLTAAAASVIWDGKATQRAVTTAMLDLASRGELSFEPEEGLLRDKVGLAVLEAPPADPYVERNRRRPLGGAERYLLTRVQSLGKSSGEVISSTELAQLAPKVKQFNQSLEEHVADQKWFREPPAKAISRWSVRGVLAFVGGVVLFFVGLEIPISGLVLIAIALVAAGIAMLLIARYMPARTMAGAMLYAMLAAYRRTLQKTMAQARSMVDVVEQAQLDWLDTPDQAVVWGVALDLHDHVQRVIERSAQDVEQGMGERAWLPGWYGSHAGYSTSFAGSGSRGFAPGLFSASAVPNFGGMMAALNSLGTSTSTSSSGGSGGFSGGGGGGGGGGAGGGF